MTNYEILTLFVSCIAVLLSVYTLTQQRKLQREANDLQKATDRLAKHQLAEIAKAEIDRQKAEIEVALGHDGSNYTLQVGNVGMGDASEVNIHFSVPLGVTNPISDGQRERLLPVRKLRSSSWALIPCIIYRDGPLSFEGTVTWKNPDGSQSEEPFAVRV